MPTITNPHNYTDGELLSAAILNPPLQTLYAWANGNVDHANVALGTGFYASDIIPTSPTQATFGGTWGYKFSPGTTTECPLTLNVPANQVVSSFRISVAGVTVGGFDAKGNLNLGSPTATNQTPFQISTPNGQAANLMLVAGTGGKQFIVQADTSILTAGSSFSFTSGTPASVNSNATGSVSAFAFNNNNAGAPTTGDIADFQINGSTKFAISNSGVPVWGGGNGVSTGDTGTVTNAMLAGGIAQAKLAAFAGLAVGGALTTVTNLTMTGDLALNTNQVIKWNGNISIFADGANTVLRPNTAGSKIQFQSFAGVSTANVSDTGLGAFAGVAVGGALTGATTGGFSNTVTVGTGGASTGLAFGGSTSLPFVFNDAAAVNGLTFSLPGSPTFGYRFFTGGFATQAFIIDANGKTTSMAASVATNHIANAAAASGGAGTVSYGGTTANTATAGTNGAPPAQVATYITINYNGTAGKIAVYNP